MPDETNPRADLDEALAAMRDTGGSRAANADRITSAATVACAEALSLLVDAHLATVKPKRKPEPEPEPDPRESLPDDTLVGHGWVVDRWDLFKPDGDRFTWWLKGKRRWAVPSASWGESDLADTRPATVGDLHRVGLPVSEWPDIEAPEPEPSRAEKAEAELRARELHHFEAEQSEAKAITERDNAIAALRAIRDELAKVAVGYVEEGADARSAFREAMHVVDAEARRRGLDMGVATA